MLSTNARRGVAVAAVALLVPIAVGCSNVSPASLTNGTEVIEQDITIQNATVVAGNPGSGEAAFLATIVNWQVHDYLKQKFGEDYVFNAEVSSWLKQNLSAMGHGIHWLDRLEKATGKRLDIEGWLANQDIF